MAWTTPRDWAAGAVVTAAQLNAHIRDSYPFTQSDRSEPRPRLQAHFSDRS